jgi:hypothetical protein
MARWLRYPSSVAVTRRDVLLLPAALVACRPDRRQEGAPVTTAAGAGDAAESVAPVASTHPMPAAPPVAPPPSPAQASASARTPEKPRETAHALAVPAADVAAAAPRAYTVSGDGHTHPITVDGAAFAKLGTAGFALVRSGPGGPDGHRHWVSVTVA